MNPAIIFGVSAYTAIAAVLATLYVVQGSGIHPALAFLSVGAICALSIYIAKVRREREDEMLTDLSAVVFEALLAEEAFDVTAE